MPFTSTCRIGLLLAVLVLASCAGSNPNDAPEAAQTTITVGENERLVTEVVFADSFETMEHWVNLTPNTVWEARGGHLIGRWRDGGSTLWCRENFEGDVLVEFEGRILSPDDSWVTEDLPEGGKNLNLNFHTTGPDGEDILDVYRHLQAEGTGPNGRGDDQYQGYFLTWTFRHARLRRSPGYENVQENRSFLPEIGTSYRFRLLRQKGRLRYWINDTLIFDYTDPQPWQRGKIGFALWRSNVQIDNVTVRRVVEATPSSSS